MSRFDVGPWDGWTGELGEKAEKTQKATVKTLWVQAHEVTNAQYAAWVNGLEAKELAEALPEGWTVAAGDGSDRETPPPGTVQLGDRGADHPVTGVTWRQAAAYAAAHDMRLPTEDEWERIAAGGDPDRAYPWGADAANKAWVHGNAKGGTAPATTAGDDVTPEGVIGLAGNVAELTATLADRKAVGRSGPKEGARIVIRGGSFRSRETECTTRFRWTVGAGETAPHVGFRCVMDDAVHRRK